MTFIFSVLLMAEKKMKKLDQCQSLPVCCMTRSIHSCVFQITQSLIHGKKTELISLPSCLCRHSKAFLDTFFVECCNYLHRVLNLVLIDFNKLTYLILQVTYVCLFVC